VKSLSFIGSYENQLFADINRMMESIRNGDDTKQKQLEAVVHDFEKKAPGAMLSLFMKSIRNPVIQEPKIPGMVLNRDQYFRDQIRKQFLEHFFDNIDFSDERILRFPVLEEKTITYFRNIVQPHPDTLQFRIMKFLAQAKASEQVYLWGIRYLYELFREASFNGSAVVCSFIANRYILPESWRWKDAGFIDKVRTRVLKADRNAPGKVATDLVLKTPEGTTKSLHSVVSTYTILYFFNPGCESCLPVTSSILNLYNKYKQKGITVFAVYPDRNRDEWLKYIRNLKPGWIHVYDPDGNQRIKEKYDIFAIPLIYLLDQDKKVIKQDIPVDELEQFLSRL
jgi:thiol-disulfide isomerase/thioredoxin